MNVQHALLCKLIHGGDITHVINSRITPEFFPDEQYRRIYEYVIEHWRKYRQPADIDVMKNAFPSYTWEQHSQSLDYFIDGLRERRRVSLITDTINDVVSYTQSKDNPDATDRILELMADCLQQVRLETYPTLDVDFTKMGDEIVARLEERMLDPGFLRGISTGYKGIDYVTGGLQPEQLVVLIGLPKAFKSATLLTMAMAAHKQAKTPLFIGFEMSNEEQYDRLVSLYSGISLTALMNGTLSWKDLQTIKAKHKILEGMRSFITSVDMASATTVPGVQAKIMEYQPEVVFIDGAYLMRSELPKAEPGSAQALTDIARELKKLAQTLSLPIVVTTQASHARSKAGLTMFSPMYTQAWQQSADVLLGVERLNPEDGDLSAAMIRLSVLASRSGPRAETVLRWDWANGSVLEMDPAQFRKEHTDGSND